MEGEATTGAGTRWQPGQSGNPGGRPKVLAEVREAAQQYGPAAIESLAKLAGLVGNGEGKAESESARIAAHAHILDRAYGRAPQSVPRPISLPDTSTVAGLLAALSVVTQALAAGDISTAEAADLAGILETQRKTYETALLEDRIKRLEDGQARK